MPDASPMLLSVVIPVRDEELNVEPLHRELSQVLHPWAAACEIIIVEDGSVDRTFERLEAIQRCDSRVRVVRFTRNFGQTAAFAAGFAYARGRFIVTLDGDLQNDPADIPRMIALAEHHDIVCGWRRQRKDDFLTRHVPSAAANWLIGLVSGIRLHDYGCSMKVFKAEVVTPLRLRPGMHRYLPALASRLGNRVTEIVVNHRPRKFGRSKYGLSRTFRVILDLLRLRAMMRDAADTSRFPEPFYQIGAVLEAPVRRVHRAGRM